MLNDRICPCGSGNKYSSCCEPYIKGLQSPPTAEALMRSRYCAYVDNNQDYLLLTWHVSTRPSSLEFGQMDEIQWQGLNVLETKSADNSDEGFVEFVAQYTVNGKVAQLHERSRFVKEEGQWFYVDGVIKQSPSIKQNKIGRNAPCPCGSGKKYKRCCGR